MVSTEPGTAHSRLFRRAPHTRRLQSAFMARSIFASGRLDCAGALRPISRDELLDTLNLQFLLGYPGRRAVDIAFKRSSSYRPLALFKRFKGLLHPLQVVLKPRHNKIISSHLNLLPSCRQSISACSGLCANVFVTRRDNCSYQQSMIFVCTQKLGASYLTTALRNSADYAQFLATIAHNTFPFEEVCSKQLTSAPKIGVTNHHDISLPMGLFCRARPRN